MLLDKIKQWLGIEKLPKDMESIYMDVANEKEALARFREARYRDETRKKRYIDDLGILHEKEKQLIEIGKAEEDEFKKFQIASEIKDIRGRKELLHQRIEICEKRINVYNSHIGILEIITESVSETLPSKHEMEELAAKARNMMAELEEKVEVAEALKPQIDVVRDEEVKDIMKELKPEVEKPTPKEEVTKEVKEEPPKKVRKREPKRERKILEE
jgi:hypothetical protein